MREYNRTKNVNTQEFWDQAWARNPEDGQNKQAVREKVCELIGRLPEERVYEYGFGAPHLARMIGKGRWYGRDHSRVAVKNAKAEGFNAAVEKCGDSPGYLKSYVVALEVLEHLDHDEMSNFLGKSRRTPHAFFSVPDLNDEGFAQHMRRWDSDDDLSEFLGRWWPFVEVHRVGHYRLAHCQRESPPREPILTVGCSTLLDFYGFQYTAASWRTHHGDFDGRVEYLIADNHPEPSGGDREISPGYVGKRVPKYPGGYDGNRVANFPEDLREVWDMEGIAKREGVRYIRWSDKQGTYPGKNQLKVQARGKWVLTMDSHVMLSPFAIERCLEVIDENPESDDFYHFPCLFRTSAGVECAADFRNQDYIYRQKAGPKKFGVYGWTKSAVTAGDPYDIAAMITSCYLVRRDAWFSAKGYDPILGNYGGWEGPLQMKWRLLGRRVLSLRHSNQEIIDKHGWLHHWHMFCQPQTRMANQTGRVHTGRTKMRNFAASSAVIGGRPWVKRHCALKGWNFGSKDIQVGMAEGLKLRPWMIKNLARPEWEDITEFFRWMLDEKIPGALTEW